MKNRDIVVTSEAFRNGDYIPREYTCDGRDISPHISWEIAHGVVSYVLIMEDPDAPGGTFTHWTMYNISAYIHILPSAIPKVPDLGAWPFIGSGFQGVTDFGTVGYGGPCPPPGKPHRYFFRVYALDTWLSLPSAASRKDLANAMANHIIAKGELMGLYRR